MECNNGKSELGFSPKILGKNDETYSKLFEKYVIRTLEEELRVLYVACTRAKNYLVFCSEKTLDKVKNKNNWLTWINEMVN